MKLSPSDRWILANQFRLMQMLSEKRNPLYEHAISILENGYEDYYGYAAQYLREEPFPSEVAQEVEDILSMFTQLQWAKERITDKSLLDHPHFEFTGFDGNNSGKHSSYSQFLYEMGKYKELGNRLEWNSHSDNIAVYRAMVRQWKSLPREGLKMTQDDVQSIVDAATGNS